VVYRTAKQLTNPFEREKLKNAVVIVITEAEAPFTEATTTIVKSLTGRDLVTYQYKYIQSSTLPDMSQFVFQGVLIMVSNKQITKILPLDEALYTRFIQLTFPTSITRFNTQVHLPDALIHIAPCLLFWAMTAPGTIFADHIRSGPRGLFQMRHDSILIDFVANELCLRETDEFTTQRDLQQKFKNYCISYGYNPRDANIKDIPEIARTLFGVKIVPFRSTVEGKRLFAYRGVVLKELAQGGQCAQMKGFRYSQLTQDPFEISWISSWASDPNIITEASVLDVLAANYKELPDDSMQEKSLPSQSPQKDPPGPILIRVVNTLVPLPETRQIIDLPTTPSVTEITPPVSPSDSSAPSVSPTESTTPLHMSEECAGLEEEETKPNEQEKSSPARRSFSFYEDFILQAKKFISKVRGFFSRCAAR
jgi:hypothetical protein